MHPGPGFLIVFTLHFFDGFDFFQPIQIGTPAIGDGDGELGSMVRVSPLSVSGFGFEVLGDSFIEPKGNGVE